METCDGLAGEGQASCYAQFGVDVGRVKTYYTAVASLEAALEEGERVAWTGWVGGRAPPCSARLGGRPNARPTLRPAPAGGHRPPPGTAPSHTPAEKSESDDDEYAAHAAPHRGGLWGDATPAPWWPRGLPRPPRGAPFFGQH